MGSPSYPMGHPHGTYHHGMSHTNEAMYITRFVRVVLGLPDVRDTIYSILHP